MIDFPIEYVPPKEVPIREDEEELSGLSLWLTLTIGEVMKPFALDVGDMPASVEDDTSHVILYLRDMIGVEHMIFFHKGHTVPPLPEPRTITDLYCLIDFIQTRLEEAGLQARTGDIAENPDVLFVTDAKGTLSRIWFFDLNTR